ncbi:MAG: OmpH family outer membrane protein [Acidobacteriota bacterium]
MRSLFASVFAVCALALVGQTAAHAQSRTGVINFQRAVLDTAEIKKALNDLQIKFKPRQEALAKATQDQQDLETQLRASQGQLSSSGAAELQVRAQRKQVDVMRMTEDLNEDVERERDAALQLASTRMQEVLKKVAADKQLDLILDVAGVPFSKPDMDVSDLAVTAYNAAHPVK